MGILQNTARKNVELRALQQLESTSENTRAPAKRKKLGHENSVKSTIEDCQRRPCDGVEIRKEGQLRSHSCCVYILFLSFFPPRVFEGAPFDVSVPCRPRLAKVTVI